MAAILPVAYLALLLMVHGVTLRGVLFGLGTLSLVTAPLLYAWTVLWPGKTCHVLLKIILVNAIFIYAGCYFLSPAGYTSPEAHIQSHYIDPAGHHTASIANLVPEIDQLLLGSYVIPLIDPCLDTWQVERVRRLFLDVYRPMREDRDFKQLGSVLGYTYRDMFFGTPGGAHFYAYIPKSNTNMPLPVIMFIHGSFGNFKGYLWVLKSLADKKELAIIAPTFGAGNWHEPGGTDLIEIMQQYCNEHPLLDGSRVYLAGLSNGGRGVIRAAKNNPEAYKGLILLSAVIEPSILKDREFNHGWRNKPVLIIHGSRDRRIPLAHVKTCSEIMKQNGLTVTSKYYPGEDHFLFFSAKRQVHYDIGEWLGW